MTTNETLLRRTSALLEGLVNALARDENRPEDIAAVNALMEASRFLLQEIRIHMEQGTPDAMSRIGCMACRGTGHVLFGNGEGWNESDIPCPNCEGTGVLHR